MKVFKFGGASVKNAEAVRNVAHVLLENKVDKTIVVVSAMGKTTNALEGVVDAFINGESYNQLIDDILNFHIKIVEELKCDNEDLVNKINREINRIQEFLISPKISEYNYIYDQVVSGGEYLSSTILSSYLNYENIQNVWLDVRDVVKTDNMYREAKVDWASSQNASQKIGTSYVYVTQGFIGLAEDGSTTTLGREGSDYTGAILAYLFNADSLTIWKDVPGVLNADPNVFSPTELIEQMSYEEAIELTYYGASVIHPKTIQPLQNKSIPLYVRSFEDPTSKGTKIFSGQCLYPELACFIRKENQHLVKISTKDFSFVNEEVISMLFKKLGDKFIKVNLVQTSAMSVTVCVEDKYKNLQNLITDLSIYFDVNYTQDVVLFTVRHDEFKSSIDQPDEDSALIVQNSKFTKQMVLKP